jgi:hypothetical protein
MKQNALPIKKRLKWLDDNLLALLSGILIVFIPLFPKIPLADAIPGYIVRLRLEDLLILFTFFVWITQLVRKKARWHPLITKLILAYLAVGFLSTLSAIFWVKSVPLDQVHVVKLYFHWLRRIEYFSLFFIFYSGVRTSTQIRNIILSLIPVTLLVSLYGYGQKYLYWPVYSTMNREFSKGLKLYLTEHARVPSTFGGHYDAAAWTMVVITIMLAIALMVKNVWIKLASLIAFLAGFWLLILTASRTSFIAYLVSVTALLFFLAFVRSFKWAIPRWVSVIAFSMFIMLSFGDLSERYRQLLGLDNFANKYYTLLFTAKTKAPTDGMSVDELAMVTTPTDENPTPDKPGNLPADVYEDIPDVTYIASTSGLIERKLVSRTFSDNAYKYGLSAAIRFDALWPRAIAGFESNPLLGSGYSTLTKEAVGVFTEAESTDNDFLRALGETGLLGFLTFFGVITVVFYFSLKQVKKSQDPLFIAFALGFAAGTIGLLVNAIYIDVFEASKVAESYWALAGLVMVIPVITSTKKPSKVPLKAKKS